MRPLHPENKKRHDFIPLSAAPFFHPVLVDLVVFFVPFQGLPSKNPSQTGVSQGEIFKKKGTFSGLTLINFQKGLFLRVEDYLFRLPRTGIFSSSPC